MALKALDQRVANTVAPPPANGAASSQPPRAPPVATAPVHASHGSVEESDEGDLGGKGKARDDAAR